MRFMQEIEMQETSKILSCMVFLRKLLNYVSVKLAVENNFVDITTSYK